MDTSILIVLFLASAACGVLRPVAHNLLDFLPGVIALGLLLLWMVGNMNEPAVAEYETLITLACTTALGEGSGIGARRFVRWLMHLQ